MDRSNTPRVASVIVTHNRPELLKAAITSLKSQSIVPQEIIVVDNASTDSTAALLQQEQGITTHRLAHNIGGSGGFAEGMKLALAKHPDWVWLIDDDTILHRHALECLLSYNERVLHGADDVAVLCPAVEEEEKLALQHRRYFDPSTLREAVVPRTRYTDRTVEIDTASFVGFLVRSSAIRQVGLPDAQFFLGYDDIDYSLRLKKAGYRLFLIPSSRAEHRRSLSSRLRHGPFGLKHYYNLRNRFIVYRKYGKALPWRWASPLAQGIVLLLVAGRGRPSAFKLWWKAMADARAQANSAPRKHAEAE